MLFALAKSYRNFALCILKTAPSCVEDAALNILYAILDANTCLLILLYLLQGHLK